MSAMPPTRRVTLRKDHPCAVGFLDETGSISSDRFFGVGLLKTQDPARLLRAIQKLRDKKHWYKEFKFTATTKAVLPLYKEFIDVVAADSAVEFFCFVADRDAADPVERFGTHWEAYSKLAEQLVVACVRGDELLSVLADNYSTPDEVLFEDSLKASANRRLQRLAVTSVFRLDSRSSDGLQAVDMLTSAIAFEFRASVGLASPKSPKGELSEYARQALGTTTCLNGWRNRSHSVAIYSHGQWTKPQSTIVDTAASST
jgi:hypothetical protein